MKTRYWVLAICILLLLIVGIFSLSEYFGNNSNTTAIPQVGEPQPLDIRDHLYTFSDNGKDVPSGFGLYTYVLYKPVLSAQDSSDRYNTFKERLYTLINAITYSTTQFNDSIVFKREYYNLFVVPDDIHNRNSEQVLYPHYFCSKLVVSFSDVNLQKVFTENDGPFLVSSKIPLSEFDSTVNNPDLLFINLSNTNPAAIDQIVTLYKSRIVEDSIDGLVEFNSLKLRILNVILSGDDNVKIVKASIAGIITLFD